MHKAPKQQAKYQQEDDPSAFGEKVEPEVGHGATVEPHPRNEIRPGSLCNEAEQRREFFPPLLGVFGGRKELKGQRFLVKITGRRDEFPVPGSQCLLLAEDMVAISGGINAGVSAGKKAVPMVFCSTSR